MAVAADIKRMLHQVFVDVFLCLVARWGFNKGPKAFQMFVHIFRATSSDNICGYALRRGAVDNSGFSSETIGEVISIDDLLKSFETTNQAVEITKELEKRLAKGGFQLTKVMSNER